MAASQALADRCIVSLVLRELSETRDKHRLQRGSDRPVELVEYPPTLVPCMLVNRLWRDEGAAIVWRNYPYLPILKQLHFAQRQWYANKIERLVLEELGDADDFAYLQDLKWPMLKHLNLRLDPAKHATLIMSLLRTKVDHLTLGGKQSTEPKHITGTILSLLLGQTNRLCSISIGPDVIDPGVPIDSKLLLHVLDTIPSIIDIRIMNASFCDKDLFFSRLSQRPQLKALEMDLDPGLSLLPILSGPTALPNTFSSLKHLHIVCYPEIALALPSHLPCVEEFHLNVARKPQQPWQDSDVSILDELLSMTSRCRRLQSLRICVAQLASDFPTARSFPTLLGSSLIKLAIGCPGLQDLDMLVLAPAAINGNNISASQFDSFCRRLPRLKILSLKLHPQTAVQLELGALQSLGTHCDQLEELRLMVALQLSNLDPIRSDTISTPDDIESPLVDSFNQASTSSTPSIAINGHQRGPSLDLEYFSGTSTLTRPLFPHLTYLAFSRPQTILSIASDAYTIASASPLDSMLDETIEEDLVRLWALPLHIHFPSLIELEAWNDWTGQDNDSLKYIFPQADVLATTREFLSGIEQDIWDDVDCPDDTRWDGGNPNQSSYIDRRSGNDWNIASQLNEFSSDDDISHVLHDVRYLDGPEGMVTPGRTKTDRQEFL
ncbi:hypothetical protein ACN47E_001059 [Coniothyrium glycines]